MADATSKLNILVRVQDEASAALRHLSNDVSDLGGSLNFAGMKAGILAGAMAAIAGAAIVNSIKAFEEAEVQMVKFDAIMKTLPPDLQAYRGEILKTANEAIKLGFDNDIAAVSIARLFQATGDAEFAFKAFQAAMDLARYKGISLEDATNALILSFSGGGRLLKQFGIEVDDHASKETILAAVFQKTQGQAEAYATTLRGANETLKQYTNEIMEALGQPFAETIKDITSQLTGFIDRQGGINALLDKFNWLMPVIGGVLVGMFAPALIMAAAAALTFLGPLGLIWAGLMALGGIIAIFTLAWKAFGEDIKKLAKELVETLKSVWQGLVDWFQENIVKWFEDKIKWVGDQIDKLKNWAKEAWSTISSLPSQISGGIKGAVGKVGGLLGFQEGGIVPGPLGAPRFAMVHGGEAVFPPGRFGGNINVYLSGDFFTDAELARKLGDVLAKEIKYQLKL